MSFRSVQKARKANQTGRRDVLRRACQSVVESTVPSNGFEPLENRVLMTIVQPAGQDYLAFEAESPEAVITTGADASTWSRVFGGSGGDNTAPFGGGALRTARHGGDVAVRGGAVTYPIQFNSPGTYFLYVRDKFDNGGDNSMWVPPPGGPINGDPATTAGNGNPFDNHNGATDRFRDYHWFGADSADNKLSYAVSDTNPTSLTFKIREPGFFIDRVVLSKTELTPEQLDALGQQGALATTNRDTNLGIAVTYTPVAGADGYNIYRSNSATGAFTKLNTDPVTDLKYVDTTGTFGTTYFYQVKPVTAGVEGAPSNTTSATMGEGAIGHYFNTTFWGNGAQPADPFTGTTEVPGTIAVRADGDLSQYVPHVAFDWGDGTPGTPGSPDPTIQSDNYSTVWVGKIHTNEAGVYTIAGFGDDDTHVYVNGVLASSDPGGHGIPALPTDINYIKPLTLAANTDYDFVLLQSEGGGGSGEFLRWITPGTTTFVNVPTENLKAVVSAPAAPTGVTRNATSGRGGVEIDFTDAATNELRYELQRSTGGGAFETVSSAAAVGGINATKLFDPTAVIGQTYQYRVLAWNFDGSTASAPVTVTVPNPTATAGASGFYFNDQWWGTGTAPATFQPIVADGSQGDFRETVPQVNYNWGTSSPAPGIIRGDQFSTLFTGTITAPVTGIYTIQAQTDDDSYVFLNNQLVSADPGGHGIRTPTTINPISLTAGQAYNFVALQSEGGGGAGILMKWITPGSQQLVDIPASAYTSSVPNAAPDQASGAPAAVTGLAAHETGASRTFLTWNDVSTNEIRYVVERATDAAFTSPDTFVLPINATSYSDTALAANTQYFYRVRAENMFGDGPNATVNTRTLAGPAEAIAGTPLNVNAHVRGTSAAPTVLVGWTDNSYFEDGFNVLRKGPGETTFTVLNATPIAAAPGAGSVLGYTDDTVVAGSTYSYEVVAASAAGQDSAPGGPATVTVTPGTGTGWHATYFNERFFSGPSVDFTDPVTADENFGDGNAGTPGSPDPTRVDVDTFSGVFEGYFTPDTTEAYTFRTASDDGIALKVIDPTTGATLVDFDNIEALRGISGAGTFQDVAGTANLTAGKAYYILGRFTENGGGAAYRFGYSTPTMPAQPIAVTQLTPPTGNEPVIAPNDPKFDRIVGPEYSFIFDDNSVSETGYEVQRGTSASGPFATVATLPADSNRFNENPDTVTPGTQYFYQVRALGPGGPSAFTAPISITPVAGGRDLTYNGSAIYQNGADNTKGTADDYVRVTPALNDQSGSFYTTNPHDTVVAGKGTDLSNGFTSSFDFIIPVGNGPLADGFTFILQRNNPFQLGGGGGGMGYSGIGNSVALKFDTYPTNTPGGRNATGAYVNGYLGDDGIDTGLEFFQGNGFHVDISYNATDHTITETITDKGDPTKTFTNVYTDGLTGAGATTPLDLKSILGGEFAYVGITAATGGANEEVRISNFKFNDDQLIPQPGGQPPLVHVTKVYVNGTGLTNNAAFRGASGTDATYGYPIPDGANQLRPIPWNGGVSKVSIQFDNDVAGSLDQADLSVRATTGGTIGTTAFAYDPATKTGTWTLASTVQVDKMRLVLNGTGVTGLDGDWVNPSTTTPAGDTFPSGDGTAGGDFNFRINVLRGDSNGDSVVNALDVADIKKRLSRRPNDGVTGANAYSIFADLNADGVINALDVAAVKSRIGTRINTLLEPASALLFA